MPNVTFTDNTATIVGLLESEAIAFLHEVGVELQSQVIRNCDEYTDTGQTKGAWQMVVDESNLSVIVGNPLQNAIWEEFGTGEYAANGDGRKGGWYVHESDLTEKAKGRMRKFVAKNGETFYFTKGKKPRRHLQKAFTKLKPKIQRRLNEMMSG